jgi:recombination protein RecA
MAKTLAPELQAAMADVNKACGPGTVFVGSELKSLVLPRITSGSLELDVALGGGWPANQWHEIYGWESHGKTALILRTIAANQRRDPNWIAVWIAAEEFVVEYAEMLGCDIDRIIPVETNVMEDAYQAVIRFLDTKAIDCVVIDSLPALIPKMEDEKLMEELQVGLGARVTNKFFRKQRRSTGRTLARADRPVTGFVVNQFREKVGVMYGDNRTTPGGHGKDFAYFVRLEVQRVEWIEAGTGDRKAKVGQVIRARTKKNKGYRPELTATMDYYFAQGPGDLHPGSFDTLKEAVNMAISHDVITRAGAYYRYGDQQWQGREALVQAVREEASLRTEIEAEVLAVTTKGGLQKLKEQAEPPEEPARRKALDRTKKETPKATARAAPKRRVPARKS